MGVIAALPRYVHLVIKKESYIVEEPFGKWLCTITVVGIRKHQCGLAGGAQLFLLHTTIYLPDCFSTSMFQVIMLIPRRVILMVDMKIRFTRPPRPPYHYLYWDN